MKMPTTSCSNVETKPSTDLGDAAKQCLNSLEKKVRNLEKRKGRIEQNQEKAKKGVKLEKEQEDSLQQYDQVMHNLEFARELHKQFLQINHEHEKMMRKQAKREKAERQVMEIKRMNEILQLQAVLNLLAEDKVRKDFLSGNQGAMVLTEDNLNQLDELYLAISPSRGDSEDEYMQQLTLAAEHIVNYLDGKDRQVAGTTYRDLKVLITLIIQCGYFKKDQQLEIVVSTATPSQKEQSAVVSTEEPANSEVHLPEQEQTHVLQQLPVDPTAVVSDNAQPQRDLAAQPQRDFAAQLKRDFVAQPQKDLPAQPQRDLAAQTMSTLEQDALFAPSSLPYQAEADSHFTQASHTASPNIPMYPSFTNGPFQFIQASYVLPESTAPALVDPAIIIAQPAKNSGRQFMPQRYDTQPHIGAQVQHLQTQYQQQMVSSMVDLQPSVNQQTRKPQQIHQDYNSQNYTQTDSLFTAQGVEALDSVSSHSGMVGHLREKSVSSSSYEIPPSIPMPTSQSLDQSSHQLQREKKFQMNVSAPVFQSMYSQAQSSEVSGGPTSSSIVAQASVPTAVETQLPTSAADVSSKSISSRDFGQSGAGDYQQVGAYQGLPSGNSYRPDSFQAPYNSYTKSGFSGGAFQTRGGINNASGLEGGVDHSGGATGNSNRGGMRGGMARGGSSDSRGASRGGFTRPLTT